jgi:hypothetical protein
MTSYDGTVPERGERAPTHTAYRTMPSSACRYHPQNEIEAANDEYGDMEIDNQGN